MFSWQWLQHMQYLLWTASMRCTASSWERHTLSVVQMLSDTALDDSLPPSPRPAACIFKASKKCSIASLKYKSIQIKPMIITYKFVCQNICECLCLCIYLDRIESKIVMATVPFVQVRSLEVRNAHLPYIFTANVRIINITLRDNVTSGCTTYLFTPKHSTTS